MKIARLAQIAPGTVTAVTIADATIALFNRDGTVTALDDACVRCGHSLAAGRFEANTICCSGCDWCYDVSSGCVSGVPALRTEKFKVVVVDGDVVLLDAT